MAHLTRRFAAAALLLLLLLGLPAASQAQGAQVFFISDVDASQFPDVRFSLRALDPDNKTVPNLSSVNVAVYENGQVMPNVQMTPHTDGPVHYILIVDLGRQSNYQFFGLANLREAITTLVNGGFFVDGVDTVEVRARQNISSDQTTTLLAPTQSGADLLNFAANFNFQNSVGATKGLLAVEDALGELVDGQAGAQTTAIIFISRFIEDPRANVAISAAESLAQSAARLYTPVYVFHTDAGINGRDVLQVLANSSKGLYTQLPRRSPVSAVSEIYGIIHGQRTWYSVQYRSLLGQSGTRVITLNSAEAPTAGTAGRYDVTVELPSVTIVQPNPGSTIQRAPSLGADGVTYIYGDTRVPVTAEIAWPGGVAPRQIRTAQLLVDGILQDTTQPPPDAAQVAFEWDISSVTAVGLNTSLLEVRVTDELDLNAGGQSTILVEVIAPPTPVPVDPMQERIQSLLTASRPLWLIVPLGLIGLLLAAALSGVVLFLTRPTQARQVLSDIRNTLIGGSRQGAKQRVLATLRVIDGPKAWVGETINISKEKTTMGRNPQAVDIPFYRDEESSISRVHATIQLDRSSFILTDHGSTSGTRVNGEWLKPNDPVQLRDGDEIVMGDLTQRGVKLRFSYLLDKTELPAARPAPSQPSQALDSPSSVGGKTQWEGFKWDEDKWNEDE